MRPWSKLLLAAGLVLAIACGGGSGSTGPSNSHAAMSATIDGSSWSGTVGVHATRTVTGGDTIVAIGGGNTGESVILGMAFNDSGPRTYLIGGIDEPANALIDQGSAVWSANITGGTGSITVDTITATRVTGTFQFDAVPVSGSGASGTRTITNGKFAVSF